MLDYIKFKFTAVLAWLLLISGKEDLILQKLARLDERMNEILELVRASNREVKESLAAIQLDVAEIRDSVVPGQAVEVELVAGPVTEQP